MPKPVQRRKIVAFLQNQWFRDPERMKRIREDVHWKDKPRWHWNATWLFFGCLTGRRLLEALGEDLCSEIYWEEISPEIGGFAASAFPADLAQYPSRPSRARAYARHRFRSSCSSRLSESRAGG